MLKQTPLHDVHESLGARMVDFGGWHMPIQYAGIIPEAEATRQRVGMFDIGHMGRLELIGPDHVAAADWVLSCNVGVLKTGRVKYGLILTEEGTVTDDVLVYCDEDRTHVVINAGNREVDRDHFRAQVAAKGFDCKVIDSTDAADPNIGASFLGEAQTMIALQGPLSETLLQRVCSSDLSELGYYKMMRSSVISIPCLLSRTGYTGEDGFEIFFPEKFAAKVWDVLTAQGEDLGVAPIGLGARDTLRTEAGMPLYGHEMDTTVSPLEAGLGFGLSWKKAPFFGYEPLAALKEQGVERKLVGFEVDTRRVPRDGCALLSDGEVIGKVTSGTWSPTLGKNIGMGMVPLALSEVGSTFDVDIRGKVHGCTVVPLPFYKRASR